MTAECFVFGMAYWLLAIIGAFISIPAFTRLYLHMTSDEHTCEHFFEDLFLLVPLGSIGFCALMFGISHYLPCISVVMVP